MMRFGNSARRFVALGFGLVLLLLIQTSPAQAAKPDKDKSDAYKRVKFNSSDGVELGGKFYAGLKGKEKDACVLLLHDFTKKTGGDSEQDEWGTLAEELQKEGYAVLSFDFRGHGDSKTVSPSVFWAAQQNRLIYPPGFNPQSPPSTIDQKNYPPAYYPHLVDDVGAAKAYLDRKSLSDKTINSSNIILIGAGQGATIGAMWADSQYRLHRQKGVGATGLPDWDEPEGRDIACAIWLSLSPRLEGATVPVEHYIDELEKTYKLPMFFMYGEQDTVGKTLAETWLKHVMPRYTMLGGVPGFNKADKELKLTRDFAVPQTKLSGSKLLNSELSTNATILEYLSKALEERGLREARRQDPEKFSYYYWTNPSPSQPPVVRGAAISGGIVSKYATEDTFKPVPLSSILLAPR